MNRDEPIREIKMDGSLGCSDHVLFCPSFHSFQICQVLESQVLSTKREKQIQDHLRNLNIHKYMAPNKMLSRVLREFGDVVTKPFSIIFEKSCQSGEVASDWKNGNIAPVFKKSDEEDAGNYWPVSPTSVPGKIWNTSSWKLYQSILKTGRWSETASVVSPRPNSAWLNLMAFHDVVDISEQTKCKWCHLHGIL